MSENEFISVKEASERYGYSGSHIRTLLAKGVIEGEKFASVWMVDPTSIEQHRARMKQLGNRKHGTWAGALNDVSSARYAMRDGDNEGVKGSEH